MNTPQFALSDGFFSNLLSLNLYYPGMERLALLEKAPKDKRYAVVAVQNSDNKVLEVRFAGSRSGANRVSSNLVNQHKDKISFRPYVIDLFQVHNRYSESYALALEFFGYKKVELKPEQLLISRGAYRIHKVGEVQVVFFNEPLFSEASMHLWYSLSANHTSFSWSYKEVLDLLLAGKIEPITGGRAKNEPAINYIPFVEKYNGEILVPDFSFNAEGVASINGFLASLSSPQSHLSTAWF